MEEIKALLAEWEEEGTASAAGVEKNIPHPKSPNRQDRTVGCPT